MMKVRVLKDSLKLLKPAVATRSSIACLNGVVFGERCIWASDMTGMIRVELDHGLDSVVSIPYGVLKDVLASLDSKASITLKADGKDLVISSADGDSTLEGWDPDDVPVFAFDEAEPVSSAIVGDGFWAEFHAVSKVASRDESRPVLTGTRIDCTSDAHRSVVVATDSYRMHLSEAAAVNQSDNPFDALVPARYFVGMADAGNQLLRRVSLRGKDWVITEVQHVTVATRVIDGTCPSWQQLMPSVNGFDRGGWAGSVEFGDYKTNERRLKLAEKFCQKNSPIRLSLNGEVAIEASTRDVAKHRTVLDAEYSDSEELTIGFNVGFFRDALAFAGESLRVISPLRPGSFFAGNRQALLMPVRLP